MTGPSRRSRPPSSWPTVYLVVTVLSVGLLAGLWHAPSHIRHHLELVTPGIVVGLFTLTALVHWYDVADGRLLRRG